MIETSAVILMAAGNSTRFGREKLLAPINGLPMVRHALQLTEQFAFCKKIAVVRSNLAEVESLCVESGLGVRLNDAPEMGMSHSLKIGIAAAGNVTAALVLLADMPFVSVAHIEALFSKFDREAGGVASSRLGVFTPPVILGRSLFPGVQGLTGDRGARDLLAHAPLVEGAADMLRDIDEPGQLKT